MYNTVQYIHELAGLDWRGDFQALDCESKDKAIAFFLTTEGKDHLDDVLPLCCEGAHIRLIQELYTDPCNFRDIYSSLCRGYRLEECFTSEATIYGDAAELQMLIDDVPENFAEAWRHILYRYFEAGFIDECYNSFRSYDWSADDARDQ